MRYLIAILILTSSISSVWGQGIAYVGDTASINQEQLNSPSLPSPLAERPMARQQFSGFPLSRQATEKDRRTDEYLQQVQYTRAAKVKQSASQETPTKKSSFFSKMKPTWLFGEEKQMDAPAQKDPFLAAQPRLSASPIGTQTEASNQVANAAFDQFSGKSNNANQRSSNVAASQGAARSPQSNKARSSSMPRNGGIAMRPPTKPTGLLNQLGLMGESSSPKQTSPQRVTSQNRALQDKAKPNAIQQLAKQAPVVPKSFQPNPSDHVAQSISNPFVNSKSDAKPIVKPQITTTKPDLVANVTSKKSLSLSAATAGVTGFGTKTSTGPNSTSTPLSANDLSEEDFIFVSDADLATMDMTDESQHVSEIEEKRVIELPAMPKISMPKEVHITESMPLLVSPVETDESFETSDELAALPTPKPFVEANTPRTMTTPTVMPTQNPFAKTRPLANANRQPSERSRALLSEAHSLAEYASSREEFTAIIQRCRYVLAIDDAQQSVDYANELAGWGLNKRGELLLDQGRNAEARVDFNDAINCDNNCWRAEHNLGVIKAQSGDYLIAKRHFERTIELNPEFAKAYANRAALLIQSGKYQEALVDYQQAIEVDPDLAMAHAGRGRVCHMLGHLEQALRHLDAAELLSPNDAMISQSRGDLLVDLGRYGQARQAYEQAIVLAPEQPNAYRNLAWMLATCPSNTFRNGKEALANAQLAIELTSKPDDIALDTHAAALAAVGRFEEAIPMLKKAIAIAPEADAEVYAERLAMYESGKAFTSVPVGLLKQATYISDKNQSVR